MPIYVRKNNCKEQFLIFFVLKQGVQQNSQLMEIDFDFFKVDEKHSIPKRGKALISEPFLSDSYFKRSIVLLTEYSPDGAVGFVLNKRVNMNVNEVVKDFPQIESTVSIGGPVSTNTLHYVHTLGDIIPNSVEVMKDIFWGGDFETVKEMIQIGMIKPHQIRFFLGYSGWMANQLEDELERDSWVVSNIHPDEIMDVQTNTLWQDMLNHVGKKYRLWKNFPENPALN